MISGQPVAQHVFFGVLDHNKLSFTEQMMVKAVRAPEGDFRGWGAIDAWAEDLAQNQPDS